MDYNYGNYNTAYVGNDEIFDHRRRMDLQEIMGRPEYEGYDYNNRGYNNHGYNNHGYNNQGYNNHGHNNQVQQMYHNNDHYNDGHRDYDRNDRNNQGNYVPDQVPFPMDREEFVEVSASIQLTSMRNINRLISTLEQNYQLSCSIVHGNVLFVTGPVPRSRAANGPRELLNIVKRVSNDSSARIDRR